MADDAHPFSLRDTERYERRELLGRGGMGRVSVARDRRLRRDVALKEVLVSPDAPQNGAARLAREAWITAQLDHPGIVHRDIKPANILVGSLGRRGWPGTGPSSVCMPSGCRPSTWKTAPCCGIAPPA